MRIYFDIENFVSYISSIYSDSNNVHEDTLLFDNLVRQQDIFIRNYPFSSQKNMNEIINKSELELLEDCSYALEHEKPVSYLDLIQELSKKMNNDTLIERFKNNFNICT